MFAIVLFELVLLVSLAILFAGHRGWYGYGSAGFGAPRRELRREPVIAMSPRELRALALDLLGAMGLASPEAFAGDERRLRARRADVFREASVLVYLEPEPPGGRVPRPLVEELSARATDEGADVAMLFTPYEIDRSADAVRDPRLELVDGAELRALLSYYLPERLPRIDACRGFGRALLPEPPIGRFGQPEPGPAS